MDINDRLIQSWESDVLGQDVCGAMTDRLNGILSLEVDEETRPVLESLREKGFDHNRMAELIGERCAVPTSLELPDELPEIEPDGGELGDGG